MKQFVTTTTAFDSIHKRGINALKHAILVLCRQVHDQPLGDLTFNIPVRNSPLAVFVKY